MNKIRYSFNFSVLYFKLSRFNEEHIKQAIKDYSENVELKLNIGKKSYEIEVRLHDKKTQNIKKISEEIYQYINNYKIEDYIIKSF
jgi:hypothetical protein